MKKLTLIIIILSGLWIIPAFGDTSSYVNIPSGSAPLPDAGGEMVINMKIGNNIYNVTLYDNAAARDFAAHLPATLNMDDFNSNEKLHYLPYSLPANTVYPRRIVSGDLMIYGTNCLVLFYETFSTSYGYTKLGRVNNAPNLSDVLGNGSIDITFSTTQ